MRYINSRFTYLLTLLTYLLFRAGNLHKKNLAASRYDRRASFLYKFFVQDSYRCVTGIRGQLAYLLTYAPFVLDKHRKLL